MEEDNEDCVDTGKEKEVGAKTTKPKEIDGNDYLLRKCLAHIKVKNNRNLLVRFI